MDRVRRAHDAGDPEAGFTLVEILVSLALAALIAVLLVQTLRVTAGASTVVARIAAAEEVQSVRDHLRRTLGSLAKRRLDGRRPAFRGGSDGLVAIIAPDAAVERPAEMQVALGGAAAGPGLDLVESRTVFDALPGVEAATQREVLLPGIASWQLRYFGAPSEHAPAAWLAAWTRPDMPPKLVEIRVAFAPGDRRRWQPLLIALGDRP